MRPEPFGSKEDPLWRTGRVGTIMARRRPWMAATVKEADVAELKKGARITGGDRNKLAADLKRKYSSGASIRELAGDTGRSYGFVHRMLSEAGVTLRGRGGATRGKKS
jgi:hypothetical protein